MTNGIISFAPPCGAAVAQSSALLCMELAFIFIFIPQTRQKQEEWNDPEREKERRESGHVSSVKRMLPGWRKSKRLSVGGEWKEEAA